MLQRLGASLVKFKNKLAGSIDRTLSDKLSDTLHIKDLGAKGNGVSEMNLFSLDKSVHLGQDTYVVSSASLTGAVVNSEGATLRLSGRIYDITKPLLSSHVVGTLNIVGDEPDTVGIISASLATDATFPVEIYAGRAVNAKYQLVDLSLSASVPVGSVLLVSANKDEQCGCFEVISKPSANVARVLMLAQGALDLTGFAGTAKVITTVLQFGNFTMLDISGGIVNLKNIALLGACYPVANGSRGNVYDPAGNKGGVSGIVARNGGLITASNVGVSGTSGTQVVAVDGGEVDFSGCFVSCGGRNGIAASQAKATFGGGVSSQNLLDNIISQDVSFIFSTNSKSAHAGRHGYIAATGSSLNLAGSKVYKCGALDPTNGCGAAASSSVLNAINATLSGNYQCGIKAIGNSDVRATNAIVSGNNIGVLVDTDSHALITGTITGNTTDVKASNGGKVEAIGATIGTASPRVNSVDGTGSLIQTTSTISNMETEQGINVGGGGIIKKIVRQRVTTVDFPSIPAGGQQVINVAVQGVLVASDSVVAVSRDSPSNRAGLLFTGLVSSDDQVTIIASNITNQDIDPPPENFNIVVIQF